MNPLIKTFTILTASLLLVCCSKRPETRIKYYGEISEDNKNGIVKIDPDDYSTFDDLVDRIENATCNGGIPAISIYENDVEYLLGLANSCRQKEVCILIKEYNVLKILDERIELFDNIVLDSLKEYMTMHYKNYGELPYFSSRPDMASIHIMYKILPILGIKSLLLNIIESYENLDVESPLIIRIDRGVPPPPPPPPPLTSYD